MKLVRQGEAEAGKIAQEYRQAGAQQEQEYAETAAALAGRHFTDHMAAPEVGAGAGEPLRTGDGFVEIQDHAGDAGPRGEFADVHVLRRGREARWRHRLRRARGVGRKGSS